MATKAEITVKIANSILAKTPQDQITPEGVAEILTDIMNLIPDNATTLSGNTLTLPDGQSIAIEPDTKAIINSGVITFADGQTADLGSIDTDTFATILNGVITTPDGVQHPYSENDTFAVFDGNTQITFEDGQVLDLSTLQSNVIWGSGEANPNGEEDPISGDQIFDSAVQSLIDDNPNKLLFWTDTTSGQIIGEDGEIINDENKTYFYVRGTGGGLGGSFSYWVPIVNDGLVPFVGGRIINVTDREINFTSDTNSNGIQVSEGNLPILGGKGQVLLGNKFEGLNTLQWFISGDLKKSGNKHIVREDICYEGDEGTTLLAETGFFDVNFSLIPSVGEHLFIQQFSYQGTTYSNSTHPDYFPDPNNAALSVVQSVSPNAAVWINTGDVFGKDFCLFLSKMVDMVEFFSGNEQDRSKWLHINNNVYFPNNDPNFQPTASDTFSWRNVNSATGAFGGQAGRNFNSVVNNINASNCTFLPEKGTRETSIDFDGNETVIYKDELGTEITGVVETPCFVGFEDFEDLKTQVEELPTNTGGSGNQKASIVLTDTELNSFDGTESSNIEIVPASPGQIVIVKNIIVERLLNTPVQQGYTNLFIGYDLIASGYPLDLMQIDINQTNDLIISEGSNVGFSQEGNLLDEQPINAPLVVRGSDGIGLSGMTGEIHITVEYELYTAKKTTQPS